MYTLSCTNLIYAQYEKTCKYMLLLWPKHYCVLDLIIFCYWFFCGIFLCHLLQTYNNSVFFESSNKLPSCCNIYILHTYMFTLTQCSSRSVLLIYISSVNFLHFLLFLVLDPRKKDIFRIGHSYN